MQAVVGMHTRRSGCKERRMWMGIGAMQNEYGIYGNERNIGGKKKNSTFGRLPEISGRDKTAECMAFLREKREEILEKLRNGETEESYPIGAESYTEKEWDKLLKKFDDIQEDVRRKMEERIKK